MTDWHKRLLIPFRPSEGDEAWLRDHVQRTGQAVNAALVAALTAYRARHEDEDEDEDER